MSKDPKIYVPKCSAKQVPNTTILKLSFKAKELRDFLNEHVNEKGYVNLCVTPRREVGQFGDTHCVWLDTWKPGNKEGFRRAAQPAEQQQTLPDNSSDVPF